MYFGDLRDSLLHLIRTRVRNGELTERGLARLLGISQPHIHNVLKGTRSLSLEMSDRFLVELQLSALDLVDRTALQRCLASRSIDQSQYSWLPVLRGRLGPSQPWPTTVDTHERFPVPSATADKMWRPVVVRLSEDARMASLFTEGDTILLDQARRARTEIDPAALYAVKRGSAGLVRRLRVTSRGLFIASEDALERPIAWERLPTETQPVMHLVRARGMLIGREVEWDV